MVQKQRYKHHLYPGWTSYTEQHHRTLQQKLQKSGLDVYIFLNPADVKEQTELWMTDYNECRPHESLDNVTPMEYRERK